MKTKKIFIGTFIILFSLGLLSFKTFQENRTIKIDGDLSLILPYNTIEVDELFSSINKSNPSIIFLRVIKPNKNKQILFAVSRYENSELMNLTTAFKEHTIDFKAENLGDLSKDYKLISYNQYKKNNKLLFVKISNPVEGICCVMYYFMKDNFSNVMYELKISGKISDIEDLKKMSEKIALSAKL